MSAPTLTEEEKVRIRHHLDFLNVVENYMLTTGVPAAVEPQFWVEGAMARVKVEALELVRKLLGRCDATEDQMFENQENQAVTKLGDIEINRDEFEQLRTQNYTHWCNKLANALGIVRNPYAPNNQGGLNVGVSNG